MPWTPHSKVDQCCPACVFLVIERLKSSAGRCSYWPSVQRLAWLGTWVSGRLSDFPQVNQSPPVLYSIQYSPLYFSSEQGHVVWGCWSETSGPG